MRIEHSKLSQENKKEIAVNEFRAGVQQSLNSIYALEGNRFVADTQTEKEALHHLAGYLNGQLGNFKGEDYDKVKEVIGEIYQLADSIEVSRPNYGEPHTTAPAEKEDYAEVNQIDVPEQEEQVEEVTTKDEFTAQEIHDARKDGKEVAQDVLGFSTKSDRKVIELIIEKNVNSENVLEFLRGFNKEVQGQQKVNHSAISTISLSLQNVFQNSKGGFFKNLNEELFFDEKDPLMRKVATDLKDYINERYGNTNPYAKEIEVLLLDEEWTGEHIKTLDDITARLLKEQVN